MSEPLVLLTFLSVLYLKGLTQKCAEEGQLSCGENSTSCYHPAFICDGSVDCEDTFKDELDCDTHTCEEGQFQCKMGHCIDASKRCDHRLDCHDNSDEDDCTWSCDEATQFKCTVSGKCLLLELRCDGTLNCGGFDDSDETECDGPCDDRQFYCSRSRNKRCINSKWRCDGEPDCQEREDEEDCPGPSQCNGLLCDDNTRCVLATQICDQRRDCLDGVDEDHCSLNCRPPQWACGGRGYGYCIDNSYRCDGFTDCADQSDEHDCGDDAPCIDSIKCKDGNCIPVAWRCDGHNDCEDGVEGGSDEADCDLCLEGEYLCRNMSCIPTDLLCNGHNNCPSGEDEEYCIGEEEVCEKEGGHYFSCNNSRKCLPNQLYCNGEDDCGDKSDEVEGCVIFDSCIINNGDCEQVCLPLLNSTHVCTCRAGYRLAHNHRSCLDIDECNSEELACSQFCTNTESSYYCTCDTGYTLDTNNRSCHAQGIAPYIVFSNILQMRQTNVQGTVSKVLFQTNHSNIIDFHYQRGEWYYVSTIETQHTDGLRYYTTVIDRRFFNDTGVQRIFSDSYLENIHDLAVDWITGTLYVVANKASNGSIIVIDTSTYKTMKILEEKLGMPRTIVLDPRDGIMFWSDIDAKEGKEGTIERANMDGSDRVVLADDVGWANGITVDYVRRKVIWIDAGSADHTIYSGRLEEMNYDGSGRRIVKFLTPNRAKPWAVSTFEDYYYWTDSDSTQEALIKCDRFNTSITVQVRIGLKVPMAVKVVHPLRQPAAVNHCLNHNCSHFCLLRRYGAACTCPKDLILQNGRSCVVRTFELICPSCPPDSPCVQVSSTGYGCVTNHSSRDGQNNIGNRNRELTKVGSISWWICLIIVLLIIIVIIIGIVGCKQAVRASCKPCINRMGQRNGQRTAQHYMQISVQATSTGVTMITEVSEGDRTKEKKESEI